MSKPDFLCTDDTSEVECAVCLSPWEKPTEIVPCGHIFCTSCLGSMKECPSCRDKVKSCKEPNRILVNLVASLKGRCSVDCGWVGTREAFFQVHVSKCPGPPPKPAAPAAPPKQPVVAAPVAVAAPKKAELLAPPPALPARNDSESLSAFFRADDDDIVLGTATPPPQPPRPNNAADRAASSQPQPLAKRGDSEFDDFFTDRAATQPPAAANATPPAAPPTGSATATVRQHQPPPSAAPASNDASMLKTTLSDCERSIVALETRFQKEMDEAAMRLAHSGRSSQGGMALPAHVQKAMKSEAQTICTNLDWMQKRFSSLIFASHTSPDAAKFQHLMTRVNSMSKVLDAVGTLGVGSNPQDRGNGGSTSDDARLSGTNNSSGASSSSQNQQRQSQEQKPWESFELSQGFYDTLVASFVQFDEDGDSQLTFEQAKRLCLWLNFPLVENELKETMLNVGRIATVETMCKYAQKHYRRPLYDYGLTFARYGEALQLFHQLDRECIGTLNEDKAVQFIENFGGKSHLAAVDLLQSTFTALRQRRFGNRSTSMFQRAKSSVGGGNGRKDEDDLPVRVSLDDVLSVLHADAEGWDTCGEIDENGVAQQKLMRRGTTTMNALAANGGDGGRTITFAGSGGAPPPSQAARYPHHHHHHHRPHQYPIGHLDPNMQQQHPYPHGHYPSHHHQHHHQQQPQYPPQQQQQLGYPPPLQNQPARQRGQTMGSFNRGGTQTHQQQRPRSSTCAQQ